MTKINRNDIVNAVANRFLKNNYVVSEKYILAEIIKEYSYHGKTFKTDPSTMIDKIMKIIVKNTRK